MEKFIRYIKNNPVLIIASVLAIITCFFVPIDSEYLNYFDYKTLCSLFCILAVVQCLKNSGFFQMVSKKTVYLFKNSRSVILALIILTFLCDLFLANDMSLITLLPLTYLVLKSTDNMEYYAFTLILQNIAANMSGMITPHGNPQNLYLYSFYNIPTFEFIKILLPQFFAVLILLCIFPMVIKKKPLTLVYEDEYELKPKRIIVYLILFIISLLVIFRVIPYIYGSLFILIAVFILDKNALKNMDWDLLLTFVAFFIFCGNVSRIEYISLLLEKILNWNVLAIGMISCQFISNVPTAVLLSKFTTDYVSLITAVNIGSLGTLISSLASLITLKEFLKHEPGKFSYYILLFTVINVIFLIIMLIVTFLFH